MELRQSLQQQKTIKLIYCLLILFLEVEINPCKKTARTRAGSGFGQTNLSDNNCKVTFTSWLYFYANRAANHGCYLLPDQADR